ncbi:MAG TPA: TolC family protein, partial [Candidatus Methylacidiphilales bacterium]|nr:TolC family protein [Candidatus Methylacidiphilales bacterium]
MFSQCNLWIPVIAAVLAFGAGGPATIFGQDATASGRAPAVKTQRAVPANRQTVRATTGISGTSGNAKPRPPVMGPEFPVLQAKHAGGGNVMTLEQAYDRTILSDQTIITAYIEIQKANLTALGTLTTLGPSVTGSLGKGTSGTSTRFPDQNYTTLSHSDSGTASISYRQTLIDFTVLPAWRQGKLGIQESRLTYQYTVRSVLYDLSDVYYRVLKQRRILAVYRESLRLAEGQLDIAQKKAAAGEVLRSDVLNAKVTVEGNRQLTIEAENALESLKSTLRNILSLPVNAPIEVVEPPEHARTVASIDRLLMQAMVQREDLRAKALFVDQTMEGRKKALAQYAPTVTAQADAAYGDYSGNSRSRQGTWNA